MLLRLVLFFVMAAGLAGFGAVAWISTRTPAPPAVVTAATPVKASVRVLAAARTMRPGMLLKPEDLTTAELSQSVAPEGARADTPPARAALLGAMLRHSVLAGQVLLSTDVMRVGDRGFLAAVLGTGMRAITVGVDAVSGTAGLIWPGDHVDLILTETLDTASAPLGRRIAGETVLHNVRVIAIDQELMQGATSSSTPTNVGAAQSRTVTLEVSPANAERVAVAMRLGHLSLSVISADTPDGPTAPGVAVEAAAQAPVTWGGDVSSALQVDPQADPGAGVMHLYEGGADRKELHF